MAQQSGRGKSEWKIWAGVILLLAAFVAVQQWLSATPTDYERKDIREAPPDNEKNRNKDLAEATMTPGRVIELETTKGRIDLVLFEKDCPTTTSRIAELVQAGCYNGTQFVRVVKNELIQTAPCKRQVRPIGLEVLKGLINAKGAVGMARGDDRNSGTSQFYILLEPMRHLDYDYTVFGRLITGMDVAFKISKGDTIKRALVRSLTPEDRRLFEKKLEIESKRKTE